jgi:ribonuclease D
VLPDGAIEYALDDVRYLIKNYHQLKIRLENEQKLEWLMEEGQSLLDIAWVASQKDNAVLQYLVLRCAQSKDNFVDKVC